MTTIPHIVWEQAYSVHVEVLDEQHRQLFDTVNRLIDIFEEGSGDALAVIQELVGYLSVHFHQEHLVMMKAAYPQMAGHNREHQKFTEKIEGFLESYRSKDPELALNMILYLKEWIHDHTTLLDIRYGDYLLKNQELLALFNASYRKDSNS